MTSRVTCQRTGPSPHIHTTFNLSNGEAEFMKYSNGSQTVDVLNYKQEFEYF